MKNIPTVTIILCLAVLLLSSCGEASTAEVADLATATAVPATTTHTPTPRPTDTPAPTDTPETAPVEPTPTEEATVEPTPRDEPPVEPTATIEVADLPENVWPLQVNQIGEIELKCQLENITANISELQPGVTQLVTADCLFKGPDGNPQTQRVSLMHQTENGVYINTATGVHFYQDVQATLEDAEGIIAQGGLLGLTDGTKVRLSLTSDSNIFHPTEGVQDTGYFDDWIDYYRTLLQELRTTGDVDETLPLYGLYLIN